MRTTKTIFITGTGTDVGKTLVTRGIIRALVHSSVKVCAVKPVESGVPKLEGVFQPHDATALRAAANSQRTIDQTCRYMFSAPVSPHLAARLENIVIDPNQLKIFLHAAQSQCDILIAEGAGGLLVPLNDQLLYGDFIATTESELLIVAPDILGTINATLLTIEAAKQRNIPICGVVLNQCTPNSLENAEAISHFGNVPVLGTFPMVTQFDDDTLGATAKAHLDLRPFMIETIL